MSVVVIPGAGDGLLPLNRTAWKLALYFARRARDYHLLIFSRRQPIPPGFNFEGHADDLLWLMEQIDWGPPVWECNSAGGPVGQWAAVKRPDLSQCLILSCTLHRSNETTSQVIEHWLSLIEQNRWQEFTWSTIQYTFKPSTVKKYRLFRPFLRFVSLHPRDRSRIVGSLLPLLNFDHRPILPEIACPALVIAGKEDRVIPVNIQKDMANLISPSLLRLYPGFGHGNDQENPAYEREVYQFVQYVNQQLL